jgi:hypothetical protein
MWTNRQQLPHDKSGNKLPNDQEPVCHESSRHAQWKHNGWWMQNGV